MKTAAAAIVKLKPREIHSLIDGGTLSLDLDFGTLDLTEESVVIQRNEKANMKVLNEGSLTIALDTEITEGLKQEGMVRDIVRSVQTMRKEKDLEVTDRIKLSINGSETVKSAVEALRITWDEECAIALEKV
jgi:isoleucyl-tRNA synthetase